MGYVADIFGWTSVFDTIILVAIVGLLVLISMWKAPRDGYERAAAITYDDTANAVNGGDTTDEPM